MAKRLARMPYCCILLGLLLATNPKQQCLAAGVTVITHGLDGNVDGWVTGMAERIPVYDGFPGTNYTLYKLYFSLSGGSYFLTWSRLGGALPTTTDSGEIIVAFDWSQLADGNSYNTYQVASVLDTALRSTNFISELNGHALAELPIHLIGHSRGGSLMCQASFLLGTNGVWVDHLTTLDPHPLNDPNFPLDGLLYSAIDAPCATYENTLFHDNIWENIGAFVYGESVSGAYVRQLDNVSGGYQNTGDSFYPHSNVHLWYHGSVDPRNPASDTEATITTTERTNWWTAYEDFGVRSGFYYSLIGGGDRLSPDQPLGQLHPAINDGYNQKWDFGAGTANNRTSLAQNNGTWPNLIKLNVTGTNVVTRGEPIIARFYYQYGGVASNVTCQFYLDGDFNVFGSNNVFTSQYLLSNTGIGSVLMVDVTLNTSNALVGTFGLHGKISDGSHTRYLYAPEIVTVISARQAPFLSSPSMNANQLLVSLNGVPGRTVVLESSSDLRNWVPLSTNTLSSSPWIYTNPTPAAFAVQFYRAVLNP
jgi:hypothetical protein